MLHPRFLKSVGKVRTTFLASLALFALSNAAWALAADLKVPTDLAVDFRDIQFSSLAGLTPYLIPDIHGLSIESLYHGFDPAPLTWSKKFGIGQESGQFLPDRLINGFILLGPMLSGVTGIWFDDMTGPVIVDDGSYKDDYGLITTVQPDRYGDAFVPLVVTGSETDPEVTILGLNGTFAIAGFSDIPRHVPEGGMLGVFAATLAGIFLIKRKTRLAA
jgi:hypothetical protein